MNYNHVSANIGCLGQARPGIRPPAQCTLEQLLPCAGYICTGAAAAASAAPMRMAGRPPLTCLRRASLPAGPAVGTRRARSRRPQVRCARLQALRCVPDAPLQPVAAAYGRAGQVRRARGQNNLDSWTPMTAATRHFHVPPRLPLQAHGAAATSSTLLLQDKQCPLSRPKPRGRVLRRW